MREAKTKQVKRGLLWPRLCLEEQEFKNLKLGSKSCVEVEDKLQLLVQGGRVG